MRGAIWVTLDEFRATVTMQTVLFGRVPATNVQFSGPAPSLVGVNQVNVVVPPNAPVGSTVPFQIQVGGVTSNHRVRIAIE